MPSRALVTKWNNSDQPWLLKQLSSITKAEGGLEESKYLVLIEQILQRYIWHPRRFCRGESYHHQLPCKLIESLESRMANPPLNLIPGAFPLERTRLSIFTLYYKTTGFRHRFFKDTLLLMTICHYLLTSSADEHQTEKWREEVDH